MASRISTQKINSQSSTKPNQINKNSSDDPASKTNQDSSFNQQNQANESSIIEGGSSED